MNSWAESRPLDSARLIELGVDVPAGDLDASGLRLLREQRGVDEVVGGLLLEGVLVRRLATACLGLRRRLLELGLIDQDELVAGHLFTVDLGHDLGNAVDVRTGGLGARLVGGGGA